MFQGPIPVEFGRFFPDGAYIAELEHLAAATRQSAEGPADCAGQAA